jgi:hypothetical protein
MYQIKHSNSLPFIVSPRCKTDRETVVIFFNVPGFKPLPAKCVRISGTPGACSVDMVFYSDNAEALCGGSEVRVLNDVRDGYYSANGQGFDAVAVALVGACAVSC